MQIFLICLHQPATLLKMTKHHIYTSMKVSGQASIISSVSSPAYTNDIDYRNLFHCYCTEILIFCFQVNFRQVSNHFKRVLESTKFAYVGTGVFHLTETWILRLLEQWCSGQDAGFSIHGTQVQNHQVGAKSTQRFILPRQFVK